MDYFPKPSQQFISKQKLIVYINPPQPHKFIAHVPVNVAK